jgi:hypothetical protein
MSSLPSSSRLSSYLPQEWLRALSAISILWITTAMGAGLVFVTQVLLARELGPAKFGLFTSSLATITMVAPLAGFGLSQYWLQVYGVEGWTANRWLRPSLRFHCSEHAVDVVDHRGLVVNRRAAGCQGYAAAAAARGLGHLGGEFARQSAAIGGTSSCAGPMAVDDAGQSIDGCSLVVIDPHAGWTFRGCRIWRDLASRRVAGTAALAHDVTWRDETEGAWASTGSSCDRPLAKCLHLWSQAWAYGLQAVLYPIFFQISTVLLKYLNGNTQAGIFGVALGVMTAIYLIPATLYQKFLLSKLHRWAVHDPKKFWMVYRHGNIAMLVSGVLIGGASRGRCTVAGADGLWRKLSPGG